MKFNEIELVVLAISAIVAIGVIIRSLYYFIYKKNQASNCKVRITLHSFLCEPLFIIYDYSKSGNEPVRLNDLKNRKEVMEFVTRNDLFIGDEFNCDIKQKGYEFTFENLVVTSDSKKHTSYDKYEIKITKIGSSELPAVLEYGSIDDVLCTEEDKKENIEGTYTFVRVIEEDRELDELVLLQ